MGDRTTVDLTLRKKDYQQIRNEPWFEEGGEEPEELGGIHDDDELILFVHHDVNYGVLDWLDELESRGIPYDQRWGPGDGYTAGVRTCRFSPEGEIEITDVSFDHRNPPLFMLERLSAGIPEDHPLICYLTKWRKDTVPRDWDGQDEGIRQYRARKLLAPQTLQE